MPDLPPWFPRDYGCVNSPRTAEGSWNSMRLVFVNTPPFLARLPARNPPHHPSRWQPAWHRSPGTLFKNLRRHRKGSYIIVVNFDRGPTPPDCAVKCEETLPTRYEKNKKGENRLRPSPSYFMAMVRGQKFSQSFFWQLKIYQRQFYSDDQ